MKHKVNLIRKICTYGPPGCGKTSFEKALAKMLKDI